VSYNPWLLYYFFSMACGAFVESRTQSISIECILNIIAIIVAVSNIRNLQCLE
jgi:hypothetical protein